MSLIHKFIQNDDYYVIDVNSGSLHMVDELVYDILDENELQDKQIILENLKLKYSKEDITEALKDISELITEGLLYSEDLYEDIAKESDKDESSPYIKALCLNIIHDCNLRCKYCFADEGEYKGARKTMSAKVGKKAIDFVIEKSGPKRNSSLRKRTGKNL